MRLARLRFYGAAWAYAPLIRPRGLGHLPHRKALLDKLLINFTFTKRCPSGGLFGGGSGGRPFACKGAGSGDGFFKVGAAACSNGGVGTGQDQHILAAGSFSL